MADSYLVGCAKLGIDVRIASPRSLWPSAEVFSLAGSIADQTRVRITITQDIESAVARLRRNRDRCVGVDGRARGGVGRAHRAAPAVSGQPRMMAMTGNPDVKFLHCLPAFHNADTTVGKEIFQRYGLTELEVTDEVFESPASVVFDEAENRMHTIKAVMVATLGS